MQTYFQAIIDHQHIDIFYCITFLRKNSLAMRVVCSSGAGRTGTFCAISTVLERVKAEGICDVFQVVKALRQQRPHMVQTLVRAILRWHKPDVATFPIT